MAFQPLHLALRYGNSKMVKLVLAKTQNVNVQDKDKETALHQSIGNKEFMEWLLERNAKVNSLFPMDLVACGWGSDSCSFSCALQSYADKRNPQPGGDDDHCRDCPLAYAKCRSLENGPFYFMDTLHSRALIPVLAISANANWGD